MPALRELESSFGRALLGNAQEALLDLIAADGLAPAARLGIYRNHVLVTLADALKATYPVVCRLVDERFFRYAADRYIPANPPAVPCLFEYGESFAEFLCAFGPCRHLEYLPDVARLEWAINRALHADDAAALDAARLGEVPADRIGDVTLALHPSVSFLCSPWPVDRIWRANQPEADPDAIVSLDAGGAQLEVQRRGEDVVFRSLDAASYALRATLARGDSLEHAAEAARNADPETDFARVLQQLLADGIVTSIGAPSPSAHAAGRR
ncbi:MAG: HvfC/BufC family peptide modification chaperone [Betaproteobacteria bacterium]